MIDYKEVLRMAKSVAALSEAQERLRVASMADERKKCKDLIDRCLDELDKLMNR